jgi:hypothetical protein
VQRDDGRDEGPAQPRHRQDEEEQALGAEQAIGAEVHRQGVLGDPLVMTELFMLGSTVHRVRPRGAKTIPTTSPFRRDSAIASYGQPRRRPAPCHSSTRVGAG